MSDLDNCPFCGGKAYLRQSPIDQTWEIECMNHFCVKIDTFFLTEDEAILKWNTRAPTTKQEVKDE